MRISGCVPHCCRPNWHVTPTAPALPQSPQLSGSGPPATRLAVWLSGHPDAAWQDLPARFAQYTAVRSSSWLIARITAWVQGVLARPPCPLSPTLRKPRRKPLNRPWRAPRQGFTVVPKRGPLRIRAHGLVDERADFVPRQAIPAGTVLPQPPGPRPTPRECAEFPG